VTATVDYCGDVHQLEESRVFVVGRDADLDVDDNPFLHRRFLTIARANGLWTLSNVGSQLTATVSDAEGRMEAFLQPGASLPIVFPRTMVRFTAGPTTYEFEILQDDPPFSAPIDAPATDGQTTVGATSLTPDQRLLVLALSEPVLRGDGRASVTVPSLAEASMRLGWTSTKFNRKLDNVCQKLAKLGVRGLHGGPDRLASNRRTRLVEYAVATRLVTKSELELLDRLVVSGDVE
jgi:hypothetical protein